MSRVALRIRRSSGLIKDFAFLGGAFLIGMMLAAGAIGLVPKGAIDPGLRTLTAQTGTRLMLSPERSNCNYSAADAARDASGVARTPRQLVCAE